MKLRVQLSNSINTCGQNMHLFLHSTGFALDMSNCQKSSVLLLRDPSQVCFCPYGYAYIYSTFQCYARLQSCKYQDQSSFYRPSRALDSWRLIGFVKISLWTHCNKMVLISRIILVNNNCPIKTIILKSCFRVISFFC